MENLIRVRDFVINVANVAYVTFQEDVVYVHFCAAKGEQSMFLKFDGAGAKPIWEHFAAKAGATFQ